MPIAINGSGTVTGISTGGISDTKAVADAAMPAGAILQVVQTVKTNAFSTNTSSMVDIPGLNVTITPSSASSKVLIMVSISIGGENNAVVGIKLLRGSTLVAAGDANVSNHNLVTFGACLYPTNGKYSSNTHSYTFLDSPNTTSATTYKIQAHNVNNNEYFLVNAPYEGGQTNYNNSLVINTTSTITAEEVAA